MKIITFNDSMIVNMDAIEFVKIKIFTNRNVASFTAKDSEESISIFNRIQESMIN